eukprot:SAG31_NODE_269_length_18741_cov_11.185441_7_plen_98_part_00
MNCGRRPGLVLHYLGLAAAVPNLLYNAPPVIIMSTTPCAPILARIIRCDFRLSPSYIACQETHPVKPAKSARVRSQEKLRCSDSSKGDMGDKGGYGG